MTDTSTIRRRRDGSIDTAFYMQRGRQARSDAAATMARRVSGKPAPRPARAETFPGGFFAALRSATR